MRCGNEYGLDEGAKARAKVSHIFSPIIKGWFDVSLYDNIRLYTKIKQECNS